MTTQKTITLYAFSELPEDIQSKVLDNNRYINVEGDFWYDYDGKTGFSSEEIRKYRLDPQKSGDLLTYKKMYFSLDREWYIQFIGANFQDEETARKFLGVPKVLWNQVDWTIIESPLRYGNTRLEYEPNNNRDYRDFTKKQMDILNRAVERFSDKMEGALRDLEKNYDYLVSDEAVRETIELNEYTFTENGRIEN